MRCDGTLNNPEIRKYYVTGELEKKKDATPLCELLKTIRDRGMNALLNNDELKPFAEGMCSNFVAERYINEDGTLAAEGNEIVNSGKAWRGLKGAFFFTILRYEGRPYLLDVELAQDSKASFKNSPERMPLEDKEYVSSESAFRNIETDPKWASCKEQPTPDEVRFSFDYKTEQCDVTVKWHDGAKSKQCKFKTTKESKFRILSTESALEHLNKFEEDQRIFEFSYQDRDSIRVKVEDMGSLENAAWIKPFFERGTFNSQRMQTADYSYQIDDIRLYVSQQDEKTVSAFLNEYLLRAAEEIYLGHDEVGRLVSSFRELFSAPDGKGYGCPTISKNSKDVYRDLLAHAKKLAKEKKRPLAYLRLQAFADLSPEDTIRPYIEQDKVINFTGQKLSFDDIVKQVFGSKRDIKSVCILSKFTATNARNARAYMLFADSIANICGAKLNLVTTSEEVRPKENKKAQEIDQNWFKKMRKSRNIQILEKPARHLRSVHDRYIKVTKNDGTIEWWVMTGELETLQFDNDFPAVREDIGTDMKGTIKELTVSKIQERGVSTVCVNLMKEVK